MIDLILLELVSFVSFLYSIILMFTSFAPIKEMMVIFIWTIGVSFIFAVLSKKSRLFDISILLLLLPLKFYNNQSAILITFISIIFIYIYTKKSLAKVNYYEYTYKLKFTIFLLIVLIGIRSILDELSGSIGYALSFIVIYLISSVILTRLMRHIDSNLEIKKIRKTNIRYLIFMTIGFSIAVFDNLRENIINILDKLLTALYYPIYLLFGKIRFDSKLDEIKVEDMNFSEPEGVLIGELPAEMLADDQIGNKLYKYFEIFTKALIFILILILVYFIYILFIRSGDKSYGNSDYTEEREYIKDKKKKKRLFRERFPSDLKEQIRYYYRRYLEKLKKNKIEVLKTDTSLEVNERAEEIFEDGLERIREIYIETRYGDKDIYHDTVKEMEGLYKKL